MDSFEKFYLPSVWVILFISSIAGQHTESIHFSYGKTFEKDWARLPNSSCGGKHQSPVPIDGNSAISMPIPALETIGFHNLLLTPLTMVNNGHSVQLKLPEIDAGSIRIFGALLDGTYKMELLHFHWGDTNCRGSEHVISHVRFPLEMHLVFYKEKYKNMTEASKHHYGLTVLAFIFQMRERDYRPLNIMIEQFPYLIEEGNTVELNKSFTLASILSKDMGVFYTYRGSLTTPPCSEVVTWIVFPDPLPISYNQMLKFRQMKTHESKLVDNFRHLQHIHSRKIFVRRGPSFSSYHHNEMKHLLTTKFWD